jgi:hypothetical protein
MIDEGWRRREWVEVLGERLLEGGDEERLSGAYLLNFSIWSWANLVMGMSRNIYKMS